MTLDEGKFSLINDFIANFAPLQQLFFDIWLCSACPANKLHSCQYVSAWFLYTCDLAFGKVTFGNIVYKVLKIIYI